MNKIYANVNEDENVDEPNFQWVVLASEAEEREAALREELDRLKRDFEQDTTIDERDCYHEFADSLALAISHHFRVEIGEHSSMNCPWLVALDVMNGTYVTDTDEGRERDALQQRLTVAEQRISLLEKPCFEDWEIDTTAGRSILVYKKCSVIEDEQAYHIVRMIEAAKSAELVHPVG